MCQNHASVRKGMQLSFMAYAGGISSPLQFAGKGYRIRSQMESISQASMVPPALLPPSHPGPPRPGEDEGRINAAGSHAITVRKTPHDG